MRLIFLLGGVHVIVHCYKFCRTFAVYCNIIDFFWIYQQNENEKGTVKYG